MSNITVFNTVAGPYANQDFMDAAVGSQLIGGLINMYFWGFGFSQFLQYLASYRFQRDSMVIKSMVYTVFFLATMQSTFHFIIMYQIILTTERGVASILRQSVLGCLDLLPVGILGAIVQSYLAFRASLLFKEKRNKFIFLSICGIGILFGLFGALSFLVLAFMRRAGTVGNALPLTPDISIAVFLYSCCSIDIIVTATLIIKLNKQIKGFRENTDGMLKHLIKLSVASASYTAIFATIPAILIVVIPKSSLNFNLAYLFPIPLSSFYAISLLHNLLSTSKIRTRGANDGYTTNKGSQIQTWNGKAPKISVIPLRFNNVEEESDEDVKQSNVGNSNNLNVRFD